jgi:hypothetical protein
MALIGCVIKKKSVIGVARSQRMAVSLGKVSAYGQLVPTARSRLPSGKDETSMISRMPSRSDRRRFNPGETARSCVAFSSL